MYTCEKRPTDIDIYTQPTLSMDCIVCSGYVTVVATALEIAPITKTSTDDSLGEEERNVSLFCLCFCAILYYQWYRGLKMLKLFLSRLLKVYRVQMLLVDKVNQ